MQQLLEGYSEFRSRVFAQHSREFAELEYCEEPKALFITCSDSRVMPEMITQCGPGEILCCRNAGNLVPPPEETSSGVGATVEYAVRTLRVPEIIVCGHSDCGAMRALLDEGRLNDMPLLRSWLCHAGPMAHAFRGVMQDPRVWPEEERLRVLTELNVIAQLRSLRASMCRPGTAERQRAHPRLDLRDTDGRGPLSRSGDRKLSAAAGAGSRHR